MPIYKILKRYAMRSKSLSFFPIFQTMQAPSLEAIIVASFLRVFLTHFGKKYATFRTLLFS